MNGINAVPISSADGFVLRLVKIELEVEPQESLISIIFESQDLKNEDSIIIKCPE